MLPGTATWPGWILLGLAGVTAAAIYLYATAHTRVATNPRSGAVYGAVLWLLSGLIVMPLLGLASSAMGAMRPGPMMLGLGIGAPAGALIAWLLFGIVLGALAPKRARARPRPARSARAPVPVGALAALLAVLAAGLSTSRGAPPRNPSTAAAMAPATEQAMLAPVDAPAAAMSAPTTMTTRSAAAPMKPRPRMPTTQRSMPPTPTLGMMLRPSWYRPGRSFAPPRFGPRASWSGVTDTTIRVLFHMPKQACGDAPSSASDQVLMNQSAFGWESTIGPLVSYFNSHGGELYVDPATPDRAAMLSYFPRGTLYGRVIQPVFELDDGGTYCEDRARSVADKALRGGYGGPLFAVVGAGFGAERAIAEQVTKPCVGDASARCPVHFGAHWFTDGWFNEKRGLAWSHWPSSSRIVQGAASWMAQRQGASRGSVDFSPQLQGKPRRFGVVTRDDPEARRTTRELFGQLARHRVTQPGGGAVGDADVVYMPATLTGRELVAEQACAKFKTEGYTTIFHLGQVLDPVLLFPACSRIDYFPEWPVSSNAYFDAAMAARGYRDVDPGSPVWGKHIEHARGVSTLMSGEMLDLPPEALPHNKVWSVVCPADSRAPHDPSCPRDQNGAWLTEPPADLVFWYWPIRMLHGLLATAGPALTPAAITKYVTEACNPCMQVDWMTMAIRYRDGDHTSVDDHVAWRWNPSRRDVMAERSAYEDTDGDGVRETPPMGAYEVDRSVLGGRRCVDFTDPRTCHPQ